MQSCLWKVVNNKLRGVSAPNEEQSKKDWQSIHFEGKQQRATWRDITWTLVLGRDSLTCSEYPNQPIDFWENCTLDDMVILIRPWRHSYSHHLIVPLLDLMHTCCWWWCGCIPWLHSWAGRRCGGLAREGSPRTWPTKHIRSSSDIIEQQNTRDHVFNTHLLWSKEENEKK